MNIQSISSKVQISRPLNNTPPSKPVNFGKWDFGPGEPQTSRIYQPILDEANKYGAFTYFLGDIFTLAHSVGDFKINPEDPDGLLICGSRVFELLNKALDDKKDYLATFPEKKLFRKPREKEEEKIIKRTLYEIERQYYLGPLQDKKSVDIARSNPDYRFDSYWTPNKRIEANEIKG